MTICITCNIEKGTDFRKGRKVCRECDNKLAREARKKDKEKEKPEFIICNKCEQKKTNFRINRGTCLDCERANGRTYRRTTDKAKVWVENNRVKMSQLQHNWYENNKEDIRKNRNERYKTDAAFKYSMIHRQTLCRMINKQCSKSKYINCSAKHLRDWISFQFSSEMSFDNYGTFWNCDRVIPVHKFLSGEVKEDVVFHWLNVQPVLKSDNLRKNKHVTLEECQKHLQKAKLYLDIRKLEDTALSSGYLVQLQDFCNNFAKHLDAGNTSGLDLVQSESSSVDTTCLEKSRQGTRLIAEPNGKNSTEKITRSFDEDGTEFVFIEDE